MTQTDNDSRAMLESLHAQMGEWIAELNHRADLDEGEAWLFLDMSEWRGYVAETVKADARQGEPDLKDDLCPLSGVGKDANGTENALIAEWQQ